MAADEGRAEPPIELRLFEGVATREEAIARLHAELRHLAMGQLARQRAGHTLQPTALANEAWLRLFGEAQPRFEGRRAFFALASRAMRAVLVDHARAHDTAKRGGGRERVSVSVSLAEDAAAQRPEFVLDLLDLEEALTELEAVDAELARLVELRFFGGLSHTAIAETLDVSERTVERRWRLARAWLLERLRA
jgi:RNA polymerase sigma factor (TIGR02999 family)